MIFLNQFDYKYQIDKQEFFWFDEKFEEKKTKFVICCWIRFLVQIKKVNLSFFWKENFKDQKKKS